MVNDKLTKVRAEIERQINELHPAKEKIGIVGGVAVKRHLENILSFIDSMQEEPTTSVWHDANILPSNPKAVIVEHNEYSTSICRAEQMSRIKGAKWAYVEDLLKL